MPEVAICTTILTIPPLGASIVFKGEGLQYPAEYFVQQLSVCLPLLIQSLLRNIVVLDWNRQESDHYNTVR
jgi:hypothetical protein